MIEYRTSLDLQSDFLCLDASALSNLLSGDSKNFTASYWKNHSRVVNFEEALTMVISCDGTDEHLIQYSVFSRSTLGCRILMSFGDISVPKNGIVYKAEDISLFNSIDEMITAASFAQNDDYRLERMTNFSKNTGQSVGVLGDFGKLVDGGIKVVAGYLIKENIKNWGNVTVSKILMLQKKYQQFCMEIATEDNSVFDVFKLFFLKDC